VRILFTLVCVLASGSATAATYQLFNGSHTFAGYYSQNQNARTYSDGPLEFTSNRTFGGRFGLGQNSRVTMQDDSLFSVTSISLGEYSHVFNGQQLEVTFAGRKADNSVIFQTFVLDGVMQGTGDSATPLYEDFQFSSNFADLQTFYMVNIAESQWDNTTYYAPSGGYEGRYVHSINGFQSFVAPTDMPGAFSTNGFSVQSLTVSYVPVPAAVWLFGSALAGLGWMRRKQTV
jgi:hypothetical protein